ncbi:MAG TPA: deoxynucleoside kinase [Oceanithermus profundus]|uniref:Deoxynucleoside kinase n=1 Tax=Oceanithermus profundus TaxID=187137 RepID=A0A7C4V7B6_9DEIN|nr:deoxynucleoside kinase [Oceanithermus profundus]
MYIAIEGPIGVGKTTLTRHLARALEGEALFEVVEENPFLPLFYEDPERYAFKVQVFFLLSRYKQLEPLAQPGLFERALVADYLFDKDFIFASLNLEGHEWQLYQDLYKNLAPRVPTPDLTIYLRAPLEVLLQRIRRRGRSFERDMDPAYLERLTEAYDRHFARFRGRLWVFDNTDVNYADDPAAAHWVTRQVLARASVD